MPAAAEVDVLVAGGGMAGMSAAAWVARQGGSVVVVEAGDDIGGSAAYAGYVWTAESRERLREVNPGGDERLGDVLSRRYEDGMAWIRELGAHTKPPVPLLGYGRGHHVDMGGYLSLCRDAVQAGSRSAVVTGTRVRSLIMDGGRVAGAVVEHRDGSEERVLARHTILATGGFQADPELRARYLGPQAATATLRSNPNSRGDGLRAGLAAGAAFGRENAGFYGHIIPTGVRYDDPMLFAKLTLYCSEHMLIFNLRGERFVDETLGDHLSAMAVLDQPESRVLLIADSRVYRDWVCGAYVQGAEAFDKFQFCYQRGARCAVAQDLDELLFLPEEWGYPAAAVHDAVVAFNEAARRGPEHLAPCRTFDPLPLSEPPYYVIEGRPAVTFTFGGLVIDSQARVLDSDGRPIPGLLAAGADAGGVYYRAYAGGLAAALVFGLQAARTAMDAASPASESVAPGAAPTSA